jgi:hypothetical protein
MALITMPSMRVESSDFGIVYNNQTFTSPFTNQTQVRALAGAYWTASITTTLYLYTETRADEIKSFLNKLRGQLNTFELGDPDYTGAKGIATGAPVVSGAGQAGATLLTSGWTASQTGILKDGDYFKVNGELKRMVQDVNSDSSGVATLVFEPPLRQSPAATVSTAVTTGAGTISPMVER